MTLASSRPDTGDHGYRIIALAVSSSLFMQFLDTSILYTALPTMADSFGVKAIDLNLAVIAYQLAMTMFIPMGGLIADRFGTRDSFVAALLLFALGSAACGIAQSVPVLIAARALQGLGGALMMPTGRLIVVRSCTKDELVSAMNWLLVPGIIGPLLGPPLGGFIVTHMSWRWIFYINLPVALIGITLSVALISNYRNDAPRNFDWIGMAYLVPALFGLVFGLESLASHGLDRMTLLLPAGIILFAGYARYARRAPAPVLDLDLLRSKTFGTSMAIGILLRISAGAIGFLLPLSLQLGLGLTAAQSGLITFMVPAGSLLSRLWMTRLSKRYFPRSILLMSIPAMAMAIAIIATNLAFGAPWIFYPILLILGVANTIPLTLVSALAYADIDQDAMGRATSFYTTVQQLTFSLAVAAAVGFLSVATFLGNYDSSDSALYMWAMLGFAVLALPAGAIAFRMPHETGAELKPASKPKI